MSEIGQLHESSLHSSLKDWVAQPGDRVEVVLDNHVIDVMRDNTLIEIQTGNFSSFGRKIRKLVDTHPIKVLYPIPIRKWIVRQDQNGQVISRRKSPKKGNLYEVFSELVRVPDLLPHPNFEMNIAFIWQEDIFLDDGKGSWRRKGWSIADRRLLDVKEVTSLTFPDSYLELIPEFPDGSFTNKDLAAALKIRLNLAQKMTYTLRKVNVLGLSGKKGNAFLFSKPSMD